VRKVTAVERFEELFVLFSDQGSAELQLRPIQNARCVVDGLTEELMELPNRLVRG
jgi:hypothetical protein